MIPTTDLHVELHGTREQKIALYVINSRRQEDTKSKDCTLESALDKIREHFKRNNG